MFIEKYSEAFGLKIRYLKTCWIAKADGLKHHKTWTIQFLAGVGWVENNSELKAYVSRKNLVLSNELIKAELQSFNNFH